MLLEEFEIVKMVPPHDTNVWVKISAEIRKNDTGEIREYVNNGMWDEEEMTPNTYIWRDGNFSCDCNRAIFFGDDDESCGEQRFSVNLKNPITGEFFYKEFEAP